ncbi:hypothetical protein HDU92_000040 [Lobulomyces angularis]|nr:hypothetical protein HDU92_000040 [Lobulomyces angularis]
MLTPVQLLPQNPPIAAVDQKFCSPQLVTLTLREKILSLSGDDFNVSDPDTGINYFKVSGRAFSIKQKKVLLDNNGFPVLNFSRMYYGCFPKFQVSASDCSRNYLFTVKKRPSFLKPKFVAKFRDIVTGEMCKIQCKGSWLVTNSIITIDRGCRGKFNRSIVAVISRNGLNVRNLLFNKDSYVLQVAPGVDLSLIITFCIILDEVAREDH